jgi:hypothetical protein
VDRGDLRPLERVILRHIDNGMSSSEIAWRFRRSPGHIERVLDLTGHPRMVRRSTATPAPALRPLERTVMRGRERGADLPEIAARLRRTPEFVGRIEQYANYKLEHRSRGTAT